MKLEQGSLRCTSCGGIARPDSFDFRGFRVGGWVCAKCGEKIINPDDAQRIFAINKLTQKQPLTAKIAKVGNSFVLRIPKAFVEALGLKDKNSLEIRVTAPNKITLGLA